MTNHDPEPHLPDYDGRSLVNLVASIAACLECETDAPPLEGLDDLHDCRSLVLLVVDGLGHEYLCERHPESFLVRHLRQPLTSVFPTTTASAITSLVTGSAPVRHAITGWFMWLREFGMVTTILPFQSRAARIDLAVQGLSPVAVLGAPPLFSRSRIPVRVVTEDWIRDSAWSRASMEGAERLGYQDLEGLFVQLAEAVRTGARRQFIYAYWSGYDALAHREGHASDGCDHLIRELDRRLEEWVGTLAGTGTRLLVTADHGFIDTRPEAHVWLHEHPELAECLALPLCGEPRAAWCYVRPGRVRAFERYVAEHLDGVCELHVSEDLIRAGWFGPGEPHPELSRRVGDYALIMKGDHVLRDRLPGEERFHFAGVHSGLTSSELRVPLVDITLGM